MESCRRWVLVGMGSTPGRFNRRFEKYGLNGLVADRASPLRVLAGQFTSLFIVVPARRYIDRCSHREGLEGAAVIVVTGIMVFAGFCRSIGLRRLLRL